MLSYSLTYSTRPDSTLAHTPFRVVVATTQPNHKTETSASLHKHSSTYIHARGHVQYGQAASINNGWTTDLFRAMSSSPEGFPDYESSSTEAGAPLYLFVVVYSISSFLLIPPLVIWARNYERRRREELQRSNFYNPDIELTQYPGDPLQQYPSQPPLHAPSQTPSQSPSQQQQQLPAYSTEDVVRQSSHSNHDVFRNPAAGATGGIQAIGTHSQLNGSVRGTRSNISNREPSMSKLFRELDRVSSVHWIVLLLCAFISFPSFCATFFCFSTNPYICSTNDMDRSESLDDSS